MFITTKLADLQWLEAYAAINPATGLPWDTEASMICRRLKVHKFTRRVAKPPRSFALCGRCFARLLQGQAAAWVASGGA